jgi:hypothetical protein
MQASLPSHNVVAGIILRSVGRLLTVSAITTIDNTILFIYLFRINWVDKIVLNPSFLTFTYNYYVVPII